MAKTNKKAVVLDSTVETTKKVTTVGASVIKKNMSGFMDFIKEQNVVGLAVGLVLGTSASALVNSLINNVLMPPLGFLLGSADGLKGLVWHMGVTPSGDVATVFYGQFINDLINFLVLAFVIYLVIKFLKLDINKK